MAKILNGILGGFSGKVGNVVGACWNGIDYMRALATSITNPKTPAQLDQRAKFSLIVAFLRPLTAFLRMSFKSASIKMSAFNAAVAYNIKNAISGVYPNYAIDFTKLVLSRGSLPGVLNPEATSTVPGSIDFTWDNNSYEADANDDDQVFMVVIHPLTNKAVTVVGGNTRASGSDSFVVPELFIGQEVQCYIGFTNANESQVSDSSYAGAVDVI